MDKKRKREKYRDIEIENALISGGRNRWNAWSYMSWDRDVSPRQERKNKRKKERNLWLNLYSSKKGKQQQFNFFTK